MFKKLRKLAEQFKEKLEPFDPGVINDPLAQKTSWSPAKGGGSNFRTHKLSPEKMGRLEFKATWVARFFYLLFVGIGLGVSIGVPLANMKDGRISWSGETLFPLIFGIIFFGFGAAMYYFGTAPIVFDRNRGVFWKGRKAPHQVFDKRQLKYYTELNQIHAIQLISEYISGNKSSYYSYELNLVLEDGSRIHVVDHGSDKGLVEDAKKLAGFLNVPIWNAI